MLEQSDIDKILKRRENATLFDKAAEMTSETNTQDLCTRRNAESFIDGSSRWHSL